MIAHLVKLRPSALRLSHFAGSLSRRNIQEFPTTRFDNTVVKADYILVLPEQLNESSTTNELLRIPRSGEPETDFSKITVETAFKGLSQSICNFENFLTDVNNTDPPYDKSIQEIFELLDGNLFPMDTAYNLLTTLLCFKSSEYSHEQIFKLLKRYHRARESRLDGNFSAYFATFSGDNYSKLHTRDKCMLSIYRDLNPRISRLKGIDIETVRGQKEFLNRDIAMFRNNLAYANHLFSHTVDDPDILSVMSPEFDVGQDMRHKERTPLQVTIQTYHKFMRLCPDRFIRQAVWATRNKRCSPKGLPRLNNSAIITSIRTNRRKLAQSLGYRTHVERKLVDTIAQAKVKVVDNLLALNEENAPQLKDRLQELNDYAADNAFEDPQMIGIQEYDVDYWSHKYIHEILIGRSEMELRSFFPLKSVQQGIHSYFKNYFDINIEQVEDYSDRAWHCEVQLYRVSKGGTLVGFLIYDPYQRTDKVLSDQAYGRIRSRSDKLNCLPLRFLSTPYKKNPKTKHANLTPLDITNLFYIYSVVLQRLMYNFGYHELNEIGALERDATNLLPNLVVAQLLTDHRIIQSCSDRGGSKTIDTDLASRIIKSASYFKVFDTWRDLYLAHLDMEAHTVLSDLRNLANEIYNVYSPFERDSDNYDYCSMDDTFVGPKDGLQYADIWSKQLATFCMSKILPPTSKQGLATVDVDVIRSFNSKLIDQLFNPEELDTKAKLQSLIGRSFEPSKASLGVL